jgi:hypothetical protein
VQSTQLFIPVKRIVRPCPTCLRLTPTELHCSRLTGKSRTVSDTPNKLPSRTALAERALTEPDNCSRGPITGGDEGRAVDKGLDGLHALHKWLKLKTAEITEKVIHANFGARQKRMEFPG